MTEGNEETAPTTVSPDQAFSLLGDETRVRILQALGRADGPLTFTALRNEVGLRQGGLFNYHLEKLLGHFVEKTEAGYELRYAGRAVVEGIYSGVFTDDPPVERIEIAYPCRYCEAPIEVELRPGFIDSYCTECDGVFDGDEATGRADRDRGRLGGHSIPPAGLDRPAEEAWRASQVWASTEIMRMANGICPRCSAPVDHELDVCAGHDPGESRCDACGNRYGATYRADCRNCIFTKRGPVGNLFFGDADLLAFALAHGWNPVDPATRWKPGWTYAEEVLSVDPFEAHFTYTMDGDEIVLAVDSDLQVETVSCDLPTIS